MRIVVGCVLVFRRSGQWLLHETRYSFQAQNNKRSGSYGWVKSLWVGFLGWQDAPMALFISKVSAGCSGTWAIRDTCELNETGGTNRLATNLQGKHQYFDHFQSTNHVQTSICDKARWKTAPGYASSRGIASATAGVWRAAPSNAGMRRGSHPWLRFRYATECKRNKWLGFLCFCTFCGNLCSCWENDTTTCPCRKSFTTPSWRAV